MKRWLTLVLVAVLNTALWAGMLAATFTVRNTPDGILLLTSKQGKECDEGGGCGVFSEREFRELLAAFLVQMAQQHPQKPSSKRGDI